MLSALIQRSPIYPSARRAYRALFKAQERLAEERMGAFYGHFFQPGEVVFDVGANQGEYSECFAREGARVVAIEPNPAFRGRLAAIARHLTILPEHVAVGDHPGVASLNICSTSGFSTFASTKSDWMLASPDYADVEWTGEVEVPIVTLDQLVERHGQPTFVKIDVEGFELNVLKGMSFDPRYLSFEYGVRRKDLGLACIELLADRGYRFRPIAGREWRFDAGDWMPGTAAAAWLEQRSLERGEYGDFFAYKSSLEGE